jgi:tetratricopeptide (TPR) repeat protein
MNLYATAQSEGLYSFFDTIRTAMRRAFSFAFILLTIQPNGRAQSSTPVFGTTVVIPSGLRGEIYFLQPNSKRLPGFSSLDPVGTVYTSQLNVTPRQFSQGFPGVTDRIEWFAIDYTGRFWIENPDQYVFALTADDGAKLYIDGRPVIDNDGIHEPQRRTAAVPLSGGIHRIRVSYFQGPRFAIALVLEVKAPDGPFHVFNTDEFRPPANPAEWKYRNADDPDAAAAPVYATDRPVPAKARTAFLAGATALADGNLHVAEKEFGRAVKMDAGYAGAWSCLGDVWDLKAVSEQARAAWERAVAADPGYAPAAVHLSYISLEQHADQEALRVTSAAIAAGVKENPLILFYDAVANAHLGHAEAAEKSARNALRLDSANEVPRAEYLLGMLLADKHDRAEAIEHLRRYLALAPAAPEAADVRKEITELGGSY